MFWGKTLPKFCSGILGGESPLFSHSVCTWRVLPSFCAKFPSGILLKFLFGGLEDVSHLLLCRPGGLGAAPGGPLGESPPITLPKPHPGAARDQPHLWLLSSSDCSEIPHRHPTPGSAGFAELPQNPPRSALGGGIPGLNPPCSIPRPCPTCPPCGIISWRRRITGTSSAPPGTSCSCWCSASGSS